MVATLEAAFLTEEKKRSPIFAREEVIGRAGETPRKKRRRLSLPSQGGGTWRTWRRTAITVFPLLQGRGGLGA